MAPEDVVVVAFDVSEAEKFVGDAFEFLGLGFRGFGGCAHILGQQQHTACACAGEGDQPV